MTAKASITWDYFVGLVFTELGIKLTKEDQDLLGEFPDPDRFQEFCKFYLKYPELHPIWRASSVDQVLGSLSMKFEKQEVEKKDLLLAKQVVNDASSNVWAARFLLANPSDYDSEEDPGDHAVGLWLRDRSGLDMNQIKSQLDRFDDPADYLE